MTITMSVLICGMVLMVLIAGVSVRKAFRQGKGLCWILIMLMIACGGASGCAVLSAPGTSREPDLSFLNYENAIPLVADLEEVKTIYCPTSGDGSGASIQLGVATGADLARYLDMWNWKECTTPKQPLPSPGSVEFIIEEDYRITVHQKKAGDLRQYAVVNYQNEVRYYQIGSHDYSDAVALCHTPAPKRLELTQEEIARVNEAFSVALFDEQGNPIGLNPMCCFFTSYYDDVRDLNFEEFMRYFPDTGLQAGEYEFEALKKVEVWPFGWVETPQDMPVPIHKYPRQMIDRVLMEYAGITTEDLDTSEVAYLEEQDAYYNYTSDFGPGIFTCTRGEVEGDQVWLYEELESGTDRLTLQKEGDSCYIVAHQRMEGELPT